MPIAVYDIVKIYDDDSQNYILKCSIHIGHYVDISYQL